MYKSILEAVYSHSREIPSHLAIADANRAYSYEELMGAIYHTQMKLKEAGIKEKQTVLVECTQNADFIIINFACALLDAIFVPFEKKTAQSRVSELFEETEAVLVVAESEYSEGIETVKPGDIVKTGELPADFEYVENNPKGAEQILFTTGTTGKPKGIVISKKADVAIAENIKFGTKMHEKSVEMIPLPLSHSHGLRTCYANFLNGSAVVAIDGVMNVALFFEMIERYDVNALDLSPTLAKLLIKIAKRGLAKISDTIEYMEIGTAVLDDDVKEKLKEIFPKARLYNFYGSTEAGRTCVLDFNKADFTGCIGHPSKNATFYIVDEEHHVVEGTKNNPGLIAVSGDMMMDGYFKAEELTKTVLIDGILYSNDLGYIDENGYVFVLGRKDDVINYKGIKIAPEEIETTASKYPGVTDCACVPQKDAVCGQVPKLFISVQDRENFDTKEYMVYLKQNLDLSRVPTQIEVIDEIPRSSNGKLKRKELLNVQP